ncbi:hypothetical protein [Kineococcus radiotolerans]|uniref:hypothetical protein n=1 Tax=Kineococcus radiotolerans TaxID=131568 RepID=UPI0012FEB4BF|nr:hypothetical protein [Kineococcus radiotolerans]
MQQRRLNMGPKRKAWGVERVTIRGRDRGLEYRQRVMRVRMPGWGSWLNIPLGRRVWVHDYTHLGPGGL